MGSLSVQLPLRPRREGGEILHAPERCGPQRLLYSAWLVLLGFDFLWLLVTLNIGEGGIRLEPFCEYC